MSKTQPGLRISRRRIGKGAPNKSHDGGLAESPTRLTHRHAAVLRALPKDGQIVGTRESAVSGRESGHQLLSTLQRDAFWKHAGCKPAKGGSTPPVPIGHGEAYPKTT